MRWWWASIAVREAANGRYLEFKEQYGRTVRTRDLSQLHLIRPHRGQRVTVIYDPADPEQATIDLGPWTWQEPALFYVLSRLSVSDRDRHSSEPGGNQKLRRGGVIETGNSVAQFQYIQVRHGCSGSSPTPIVSTPARATLSSLSTVLPLTPIAPVNTPSSSTIGTPPGNVISPSFECSIP